MSRKKKDEEIETTPPPDEAEAQAETDVDAEDNADTGETEAPKSGEEETAGGPPTRRMLEDEELPHHFETEPHIRAADALDPEATLNLSGEDLEGALRDDAQSPLAQTIEGVAAAIPQNQLGRDHLKGLLEALIFASDKPLKPGDLARSAAAPVKEVKLLLAVLKADYANRGVQLDEVAGGWIFRTNVTYAPFVRDMAAQKPVRLTRAQVETLAILAYRQPMTRPEIDDVRGVDCGATLKLLLERDLVKILGKKDEPGRPLLYGTTPHFLEFFGLNSLKDLPTLREYTELNEESRRVVERELGETLDAAQPEAGEGVSESATATATDGEAAGEAEAEPSTSENEAPPASAVEPTAADLGAEDAPESSDLGESETSPET